MGAIEVENLLLELGVTDNPVTAISRQQLKKIYNIKKIPISVNRGFAKLVRTGELIYDMEMGLCGRYTQRIYFSEKSYKRIMESKRRSEANVSKRS